jgi:uncharacterized protein YodC (DUF2158 family)
MRTRAILLMVAVGMTVSSCAADPAPIPAPTSASPTPSETAEPIVGKPGSRVPGTCADLEDQAAIAALLPGAVAAISSGMPADSYDAAFQQSGMRTCRWESPETGSAISVGILPGASSQYKPSGEPSAVVDTVGDQSSLSCYDIGDLSYVKCYFSFTVDDYWANGWVDAEPNLLSLADFVAGLTAVLESAAAGLHELGSPLPEWQSPQTLAGNGTCAGLDVANVVSAALGGEYTVDDYGFPEDGSALTIYAYARSGMAGCIWSAVDGSFEMRALVLPGGAWSWDLIDHGAREPISIIGSDDAYRWTSDYRDEIEVLLEDSTVSIGYYPRGDESAARAVAAAAALLPVLPLIP